MTRLHSCDGPSQRQLGKKGAGRISSHVKPPAELVMKRHRVWIALLGVLASDHGIRAQTNTLRGLSVTVRPMTVAAGIEELAGATVNVPQARVVGVFNPRVFVVDTAAALMPVTGHRGRVLVLVDDRELKVPSTLLVASTVTVVGVARTLLGVQVTREVPWPRELTPELVKRLEIRAAILATSVRSADGVELTSGPANADAPPAPGGRDAAPVPTGRRADAAPR